MAPTGKYQLSLGQLAEFDDLLTDALVDRVYYWTTIRKMRSKFLANRGIKTEEVLRIITQEIVRNRNTTAAVERFIELDGIKQYMSRFGKNENGKADFVKHARRYLSIYQPDAGFEVSSTNRYNITRPEACVLARKSYRENDTIKYLTGAMVKMTDSEEAEFTKSAQDFSIIHSSRIGGVSLLLGPARFVNHDCQPNCKFSTTNKENVQLLVQRVIEPGEEITVRYADDYFGEGNIECLCRTCEVEMKNGWANSDDLNEDASGIETPILGETIVTRSSRSSKRKSTGTNTPVDLYERKRRTLGSAMPSPPTTDRANSEDVSRSGSLNIVNSQPKSTSPDVGLETPPGDETTTPEDLSAGKSQVAAPVDVVDAMEPSDIASTLLSLSQTIVPPFSTPKQLHEIKNEDLVKSVIKCLDGSSGVQASGDGNTCSNVQESIKMEQPEIPSPPVDPYADEILSDFTEIDDSDFDEVHKTVDMEKRRRKLANRAKSSHKRRKSTTTVTTPVIFYEPVRKRVPGDYRISEQDGIKCLCYDCHEVFWHEHKWFVPRACKRCERHSKIYGLIWPKTFKKKNDTEEQIEDHRIIQRYVTASEHRKEQKKLEQDQAIREAIKAKRRASYNPKKAPLTTITTAAAPATTAAMSRAKLAATKGGKRRFSKEAENREDDENDDDLDDVFAAMKALPKKRKLSVEN